jgi:hypothetical protein
MLSPLLEIGQRTRPGVRRVFEREPRIVRVLASTRVPSLIEAATGPGARVVRSILFDTIAQESAEGVRASSEAAEALASKSDRLRTLVEKFTIEPPAARA